MRVIDERFRVKPRLSLSSKDLYKRFKMNNLNIPSTGDSDYSESSEMADVKRMSKTQLMSKMQENAERISNLKNKLGNGK